MISFNLASASSAVSYRKRLADSRKKDKGLEYLRAFEHQLVVHLEYHVPAQSVQQLILVCFDHCMNDDVRCSSLNAAESEV